jgi:hypothetical protein
MTTRDERDLRLLKAHAVISTAVIGVLLLGGFRQAAPPAAAPGTQKVKFDEIDVQRINVIEPNGTLRMVISNAARSQGPLYKGKPFFYTGVERPRTGIIFFSEEGTEVGGLIYAGRQRGDTGYTALGHLSFDQFNQDQVIAIQYVDRNGKRRMGIQFSDRLGNPRIRLLVDSLGAARLEFLDASGRVTHRIPDASSSGGR